jgi:hypothetical protein
LLPGTVRGAGSLAAGAGFAPDTGGGFTVYAHGGGTCVCAAATEARAARPRAADTTRLMRS